MRIEEDRAEEAEETEAEKERLCRERFEQVTFRSSPVIAMLWCASRAPPQPKIDIALRIPHEEFASSVSAIDTVVGSRSAHHRCRSLAAAIQVGQWLLDVSKLGSL